MFLFYVIGFFFVYKIIFLFLSSKYAVEASIFLFYVIGFFFVYKIIFLFLSSKYAVEACDTNTYILLT
jgi:hypothetical protein